MPQRERFRLFLLGITALLFVVNVPGWSFGLARVGVSSPYAVAWLLFVLIMAIASQRIDSTLKDRKKPEWQTQLFDLPFFVLWCAAFFSLLTSTTFGLVFAIVAALLGNSLGTMFGEANMLLFSLGAVISLYGIYVRRRWVLIDRRTIHAGTSPLKGLRIAHLSDLHIGSFANLETGLAWAEMANRENADLVVVTGDLVSNGIAFHADIVEVLAALRAKTGVYVSMGNHDYFGNGEPLLSMMRERGICVLRNEGVSLEHQGAPYYLCATDDLWSKRASIADALKSRVGDVPTILMAHQPELFDEAKSNNVLLTLSGHTHGGQVAMPFLAETLSLAHLAYRYAVGIYRDGDAWLYISPGLGTTGPPIRIGAAPTLAVLTIDT